jgi:hypothetical protein
MKGHMLKAREVMRFAFTSSGKPGFVTGTRDPSVTTGEELEFDGVMGACKVIGAAGLSGFAMGRGTEPCPPAASLGMHTTLDLGHLCFLAVLCNLNFHPHASHCCSRGGCLATFAAS